jgi:hypothetical protein
VAGLRERGGIPARRQVIADLLLVVPQQAVQCQHVGVVDEGQVVVARVKRLTV